MYVKLWHTPLFFFWLDPFIINFAGGIYSNWKMAPCQDQQMAKWASGVKVWKWFPDAVGVLLGWSWT